MVKLLFWKMLRDIRRSAATYFICAAVIAVGFCGFSVLSIAAQGLAASRDAFYAQTAFCDVFVEVHEAPASAVQRLERVSGVRRAQARLVETVRVLDLPNGAEAELQLISMQEGGLNVPLVTRGSLPQPGARELVAADAFLKAHGLAAGDAIQLVANGRRTAFTVSGSGISPENIYMIKNVAELMPNPAKYEAAFLNYTTLSRLLGRAGRANSFVLTLEPGYTAAQVEDGVKEALKPYGCYRVYGRDDQTSVSMLGQELESLDKMSGVLPVLFLAVSAVILSITLRRLIEQQRTQIGTLMAAGIPERTIAVHYMWYGAFTGLCGGVAGGLSGNLLAGPMSDFYRVFFSLPAAENQFSVFYIVVGAVAPAVACAAVGWLTVRRTAQLTPAEALRPAPPPSARVSLLEKIPGLVQVLTVPGLLAVRSISRNRRRTAMALGGVACAYMITATLLSMSSLFNVYLFDDLEKNQRQDITVSFTQPVAAHDALRAVRAPGVETVEGIVEFPATLYGTGGKTDCTIQGIAQDSALCLLRDEAGNLLRVKEEGIVLSRHAANRLGARVGDLIDVEVQYPRERTTPVRVTGIAAQYLGSTAYVSHNGAARVSDYRGVYTSVLVKAPGEAKEELLARLDGAEQLAGATSRMERLAQYRSMMALMLGMMTYMVSLGILVGFAVVYTGSLISYEELRREIAVMQMLGLSNGQCLDVVSTGQWLLAIGGIALGVPVTMWVSRWMAQSFSTDLFSIPDFVDAQSLLLAAVLTLLAVWLSTRAIYKKLNQLEPADVLRERE